MQLAPRNLGVHGEMLLALSDVNGGNSIVSGIPSPDGEFRAGTNSLPALEYKIYWRDTQGFTPDYESRAMLLKLPVSR